MDSMEPNGCYSRHGVIAGLIPSDPQPIVSVPTMSRFVRIRQDCSNLPAALLCSAESCQRLYAPRFTHVSSVPKPTGDMAKSTADKWYT